ncbi:MAG: DUF2306 domain-containing protein [Vicinamibacterales bacterium]
MVAAVYFMQRDVPGYLEYTPAAFGELWPRAGSAVSHVFAAAIAFALGFLQFVPSLRTRYPAVHRLAGRVYVIGTLVGAPAAMSLGAQSSCVLCRPPLVTLGFLWFLTTGLAFVAIRVGDRAQHRAFMIRSFALMNVFSLIRLSEPLTFGLAPGDARVIREWSCMALIMLGTEVALTWWPAGRRLLQRRGAGSRMRGAEGVA